MWFSVLNTCLKEANSVASCAVEMGGDGRGDKNMGIRYQTGQFIVSVHSVE